MAQLRMRNGPSDILPDEAPASSQATGLLPTAPSAPPRDPHGNYAGSHALVDGDNSAHARQTASYAAST